MKTSYYGRILDTAFDGYIAVDEEGLVLSFNKKACDLFGYSHDDVVGAKLVDLIIPTQLQHSFFELYPSILSEARTHGFEKRFETKVWGKNHNEFPVEISIWTTQNGNEIIFNAFVHDISERKKLDQLKDDFIGTVSHELRTPLTIVKGAITNLRDGFVGALTKEQLKVIEIGSRNVDRLGRIINNLLDLSRLESGHVKMKHERLEVLKMINGFVESFQAESPEKKITISTHSREIPDILADSTLMTQLFHNIISNAVRYARSRVNIELNIVSLNDVPVHVRSEMLMEQNKSELIQITVKDDGEGIPEAQFNDLFNKFVQINRPSGGAGYKGTGLGLTISKEIVRLHHGGIWAKSTEGVGSTFNMVLPVYNEAIFFSKIFKKMSMAAIDKGQNLAYLQVVLKDPMGITVKNESKGLQFLMERLGDAIENDILRREDILFRHTLANCFSVLAQTTRKGAYSIAQRISHILGEMLDADQFYSGYEIQVGTAMYLADGDDLEQLMNHASRHMQSFSKSRILLVDNEGVLLQMLTLYLQSHGFVVDVALSAEKALEKIKTFRPNLLVLDTACGWDLCYALKQNHDTASMPIIVLTGSQETGITAKAKKAQVDELLYKPCDEKRLVEAIKQALKKKQPSLHSQNFLHP
ncbi:PAS domain S-box protein [bacterium]|nr:PAS domain S-box protein [bacterium]